MKHVDQILVVISFNTELTGQSEEREGHGGGRESERVREGGREGERESSSQLSVCVHDIVFRKFHGFPTIKGNL